MLHFTSDQFVQWLGIYFWPMLRIMALISTAPILSEKSVPKRVKVGLGMVITIIVAPSLPAVDIPIFSPNAIWIALQQVMIGVAVGFTMQLAFAAVRTAGELIGLQMGLSFATFVDPGSHLNMPVLARIIDLLAMLASFVIQPTVSPATFDFHTGLAQALATMAGLLMCLGYLAWVMRGLEVPRAAHYLNWLAPAGRMALTNYLVQSIVCTLVFYGYGLGFFEHLPRMWQVPFALGLYTVQVLYSHWWLQRFRFGPAEWLWRSITYWKLQPMRRIAA